MKKGLHLLVTGRVQGVGFRHFVIKTARRHHVLGWVKNLIDGRVEIMAEGQESNLRDFLAEVKKGPMFAHVERIATDWQEHQDRFDDFQIVA